MPTSNVMSAGARQRYQAGKVHLNNGEASAALACFDEARCFARNNFDIESCRVLALSAIRDEGWCTRADEAARTLVARFGTAEPWALYCFAEVLLQAKLYAYAQLYIDSALSHRQFARQPRALKEAMTAKKQRIADSAGKDPGTQEELSADVLAVRDRLQSEIVRRPRKDFTVMLPDDVLINIAYHGLDMRDDFVVKMSKVCRRWRTLTLGQPSLWYTLRVTGLNGPQSRRKAEVWLKRSRHGIRKLHVGSYALEDLCALADLLAPAFPALRELAIEGDAAGVRSKSPLLTQISPLRRLRLLRVPVTLQCLAEWYPSLEVLSLDLDTLNYSYGPYTTPFPLLKTLRIHQCMNRTEETPDYILLDLLKASPGLKEIDFVDVPICWTGAGHKVSTILLERLVRISTSRQVLRIPTTSSDFVLPHLSLPSIQVLESNRTFDRYLGLMLHQMTPHNLSKLTYLDLSFVTPSRYDIMLPGETRSIHETLASAAPALSSLQFLDISGLDLTDTTFETILSRKDGKHVLPNLVALSVACNPELTAPPVRDFIFSRLPRSSLPRYAGDGAARSDTKKPPTAGQAFKPIAIGQAGAASQPQQTKSSNGTAGASVSSRRKRKATDLLDDLLGLQPGPSPSRQGGASGALARSASTAKQASTTTAAGMAPQPPVSDPPTSQVRAAVETDPSEVFEAPDTNDPPVKQIRWLCIDRCSAINPDLETMLKPYVEFGRHTSIEERDKQRLGAENWGWTPKCPAALLSDPMSRLRT